jgi:hypothetical protein
MRSFFLVSRTLVRELFKQSQTKVGDTNNKNMKTFLIVPILFCLFLNQKNDFPKEKRDPSVSGTKNVFFTQNIDNQIVVDCKKSIQFDMTSVTTVKKVPKPIWQQRQEGQTEIVPISTESVDEFTEKSLLDICINSTGECKWNVSNKVGKAPVYSPLGIYVVSCLRQMSGDYGALPEKVVNDMRAQGCSVEGIGNQSIVVKTPRHPTTGHFGMMLMDTSRCAFIGSSLYNGEDRLQFKVIYNYQLNDKNEQVLASATLISNDFEHQTVTETTTFFKPKM